MGQNEQEREDLPLAKAATLLLEECRMVLPGIQALFGFQLIAVFSEGFSQKLSRFDQYLHFAAITLVTVAIALVMAPAAYHRLTGPRKVSNQFVRLASGLLLASMLPLSLGICLDLYIVSTALGLTVTGIIVGGSLFLLYITLWLLVPSMIRRRKQ